MVQTDTYGRKWDEKDNLLECPLPTNWKVEQGVPYRGMDKYFLTGQLFGKEMPLGLVELERITHHSGILDKEGQNFENITKLQPERYAKLIAAAPDLLECVKLVLEALQREKIEGNPNLEPEIEQIYQLVNKVYKKATD